MKQLTATLLLLWMIGWAGTAIYGAVTNVPVVQGVVGGTPVPFTATAATDTQLSHTFAPNGTWTFSVAGYRTVMLEIQDNAATWNGKLAGSRSIEGAAFLDTGTFFSPGNYSTTALDEMGPTFSVPGISWIPVAGCASLKLTAYGGAAGSIVVTASLTTSDPVAMMPFSFPTLTAAVQPFQGGQAVQTLCMDASTETGTVLPEAFRGLPDTVSTAKTFSLSASVPLLYDGTTVSRGRAGSAANLSAQSSLGSALVTGPGNWTSTNTPAVNTQATISKTAGAAGVRHVCTSISAFIDSSALLAGADNQNVVLRDGATGAGAILWQGLLSLPVTAGASDKLLASNLNIVGSAATAMTLEFTAAGGATTLESVSLTGYDAP